MSSIYTSIFEKGEVDTAGLVTKKRRRKEGGRKKERKRMKGGRKKRNGNVSYTN